MLQTNSIAWDLSLLYLFNHTAVSRTGPNWVMPFLSDSFLTLHHVFITQVQEWTWLGVGAILPCFRSTYECWSTGSHWGKVHGNSISLGKKQWTSKQHRMLQGPWKLQALFSLIMLTILLTVFSLTLSIMKRTGIISGKPIFFQVFFPKIFWELMFLRFLIWKHQLFFYILRTCLIRCWQD